MDADQLTATEWELARIWAETLNLGPVSRDDDFFEIGGDSLLATKVIVRARRVWKIESTVQLLLAHPVLKDLAIQIDTLVAASTAPAG